MIPFPPVNPENPENSENPENPENPQNFENPQNLDARPIRKISVDFDWVQANQLRERADTFIAANVLGHLHIIIVRISVFHRLNTAIELGIVLVHEEVGAVPAHELDCGLAQRRVFARNPFVPVVDIEKLRVTLDCFVPTLLEINAVAFGMLHLAPQPRHVGRLGQIIFVQKRLTRLPRPGLARQAGRMLCRRDGSFFFLAVMA